MRHTEVTHALQREAIRSPPSTDKQTPSLRLARLWQELPAEARQHALRILNRVIGQQLLAPPVVKEVAHEQH